MPITRCVNHGLQPSVMLCEHVEVDYRAQRPFDVHVAFDEMAEPLLLCPLCRDWMNTTFGEGQLPDSRDFPFRIAGACWVEVEQWASGRQLDKQLTNEVDALGIEVGIRIDEARLSQRHPRIDESLVDVESRLAKLRNARTAG